MSNLEEKLKILFDYLEYYTTFAAQPINYKKIELVWTARAIGKPQFNIAMGEHQIAWINSFKYLGYHLSSKLGSGKMISTFRHKIRQRVAIIRSCRLCGTTSIKLRRILFSAYVMPLFMWLFGIYLLLSDCQKDQLGHFYFTCLKRALGIPFWNDIVFAAIYNKSLLEKFCWEYWRRYRKALACFTDELILFEQSVHNTF